ncbi:MAG: DUF87 domain-containing protein [Candidatus Spechtbacteria bacterium SB0662_bin_43]|uniref:DUF87 domain-containing protein n=1 Tax=Candidatus Spechtbacteria bacterium SB0662_bin_43 TaxID=2604897 RepID=A0A845D9H2_9BACT|nr:DUF87 domain-containing protein [Candidatus Spechtbacteria bacterium SB0662_bin_43]
MAQQKKQKKDISLHTRAERALKDVLAPQSITVTSNHIKLSDNVYARTLFVLHYPRYISQGWLTPLINMGKVIDISISIDAIPTEKILKKLQKQLVGVEVEMMERREKGLIRDPVLDAAYTNIEKLRDQLQTVQERMFEMGIYITLYAKTIEELDNLENEVRSDLESRLIYPKNALMQQKQGFNSVIPIGKDSLNVKTPFHTSPLSSVFPFVSFDLSGESGILYGVNRHNASLVLFDRFSLENANTVTIGKSGSGKSYAIKLEILRSLMMGSDVIVIDPENEYQYLAEATGGSFFRVSLTSSDIINPFDLPEPTADETPANILRSNIISLLSLFKVMLGGEVSHAQESLLNEAINQAYASYDITPNRTTFQGATIPTISDLASILESMSGGEEIAQQLGQYVSGIYSGLLNGQSNITLKGKLIVFNIRDMEDVLRPVAMHLIVNHIWKSIRSQLKKRILVIDEAWWLLQYPESASFLFGIVKRARKYYLGVTTITQDVSDFMNSDHGQAIITNSSIWLLMKQSPATIDSLQKVFNLTNEEKYMLLESSVGEGLFFAGTKHVALKVIASYVEDQIITTDPEQRMRIQQAKNEFGPSQEIEIDPQNNG